MWGFHLLDLAMLIIENKFQTNVEGRGEYLHLFCPVCFYHINMWEDEFEEELYKICWKCNKIKRVEGWLTKARIIVFKDGTFKRQNEVSLI